MLLSFAAHLKTGLVWVQVDGSEYKYRIYRNF